MTEQEILSAYTFWVSLLKQDAIDLIGASGEFLRHGQADLIFAKNASLKSLSFHAYINGLTIEFSSVGIMLNRYILQTVLCCAMFVLYKMTPRRIIKGVQQTTKHPTIIAIACAKIIIKGDFFCTNLVLTLIGFLELSVCDEATLKIPT
jgi:hypothetical protein